MIFWPSGDRRAPIILLLTAFAGDLASSWSYHHQNGSRCPHRRWTYRAAGTFPTLEACGIRYSRKESINLIPVLLNRVRYFRSLYMSDPQETDVPAGHDAEQTISTEAASRDTGPRTITAAAADTTGSTTGRAIMDLAIPAALALLVDPLMTLVDTALVGRYTTRDGPAPLAGMGSAASLLTFSFYLFNFLCTVTTPLVAQQRAMGQDKQARAVAGQILSFSLVLGAIVLTGLWSFREPLLTIMGTDNTGPVANKYAISFLSIRALAAPAVFCMEASTGILRGYLDTRTPVFILLAANVINLGLDILLIVWAGLGPVGAAIATTSAEWVSAGLFLSVLAGRLPSAAGPRLLGRGEPESIVPLWSIPAWSDVRPLIVGSASVFFRALTLQLSLSAAAVLAAHSSAATVDSTTVAATSVAAHQVGIQLWLLCSFFCDSLAAASQGLVADALGRADPAAVRDISKTVFSYGLILGIFLAAILQIGESTGLLYQLFTQDRGVRSALSRILPMIIAAQPLNAFVFAADGVLQGASEFPYQAKSVALSALLAGSTFAVLEYSSNDTNVETLVHVWLGLIALQVTRGLTSLWKLVDFDGPIDLLNKRKGVP